MHQGRQDVVPLLALLEAPVEEAELDADTAVRLVVFATGSSEYWADKGLDWVDQGVLNDDVARSLLRLSQNRGYSQQTRRRAWRHVKIRDDLTSP